MKPIYLAGLLAAGVLALSGCSAASALTTKMRVSHAASDAWARFNDDHECIDYSDDIEDGFLKGYKSYILTSRPCPQPMVPSKYYRPWYRTCFGQHEVAAWKEGFLFGQSIASQDCVTGYNGCSRAGCLGHGSSGRCSSGRCASGSCATGQCATGQCSTGQCSTGQCSTGQCSTGQCGIGQPFVGGHPSGPHGYGAFGPAYSEGGLPPDVSAYEEFRTESTQMQSPVEWPPMLPPSAAPAASGVPPAPSDPPATEDKSAETPAASPSARLELPAPTSSDLTAEEALKDPPQSEVPSRNTSTQRPVQLRGPLTVPDSGPAALESPTTSEPSTTDAPLPGRGPALNSPGEANGPATNGVTLDVPLPATSSETPAASPSSSDPFETPTPRTSPPTTNTGWKPMDWKPTRQPAAPQRPITYPIP